MFWFKKVVFTNYAHFSGRARRKEYWMFYITYFFIALCLSALIGVLGGGGVILLRIFFLLLLIPAAAVTIRRFHDTGRSGWWLIPYWFMNPLITTVVYIPIHQVADSGSPTLIIKGIYITSILLFLVSLVFLLLNSQPGHNWWGPSPKEVEQNRISNFGL